MKSKNLLAFAVFMAVVLLVLVPYVRFVIQRSSLDADLGMIMLDYSTMGPKKFRERVESLCTKARLEHGTYEVTVEEDRNSKTVVVEIHYQAVFKMFFIPRTEEVVLRNETKNLGL